MKCLADDDASAHLVLIFVFQVFVSSSSSQVAVVSAHSYHISHIHMYSIFQTYHHTFLSSCRWRQYRAWNYRSCPKGMIIFVSTLITLVGGKVLLDKGSTGVFLSRKKILVTRSSSEWTCKWSHAHEKDYWFSTGWKHDWNINRLRFCCWGSSDGIWLLQILVYDMYYKLFVIMVGKCMTVSEEED